MSLCQLGAFVCHLVTQCVKCIVLVYRGMYFGSQYLSAVLLTLLIEKKKGSN